MWTIAILLLPCAAAAQVFPNIPIPPDLVQYLSLTQAQAQEISRNNAAYQAVQTATFDRIHTVNREIGEETAKAEPNTAALGARYQEIESICRQNETPLRELRERQARVLTDQQRTLLRALEDSSRLQLLATIAEALLLIPVRQRLPDGFPVVFNGTPIRPLLGLPFFTTVSSIDLPPDLVAYLELNSSQLDRLRRAYRSYQEFYQARSGRMSEVAAELQAELAREAPAATELGGRYWELEAQRRQIAEREVVLRGEIGSVLTTEQARRLTELSRPASFYFLAQTAQQLNLLPPTTTQRPASRASSVVIRVTSPGSSFTSTSGLLSLSDPVQGTATSIYRTCLAGPEFEYRQEIPFNPTPRILQSSR